MTQPPGPSGGDPSAPRPDRDPLAPQPPYGAPPQPPSAQPYSQPPYAQPPYAQPPVAYGPQPGTQPYGPAGRIEPGPALSWAWARFTESAGAWIGGMIVWGILMTLAIGLPILGAIAAITGLNQASPSGEVPAGPIIGMILSFLALIVLSLLVGSLLLAAILSAAQKAADGGKVTFGDVMRPQRFGMYLLLALLLAVVNMVASFIPVVGTVVAGYVLWFAPNAVVQEDREGPIAAVGRSWGLTTGRFGEAAVGFLIALGLNLLGGLILVGLIVTTPLAALLQTYYYRRLQGRSLAPAG